MGNQLTSKGALGYQGTNANMPPNTFVFNRAPTTQDYQNFEVGDFWVYRISRTSNNSNLYVLLGVVQHVANWALVTGSSGIVEYLEGNSGGPVGPDAAHVINVIGDGTTIDVAGNAGTNTLTITALNTGTVTTLHTDDGHNVTQTAGVINIAGGTGIATTGTVGPNTVTISTTGAVAESFPTDSGTATPSGNVLNIIANVAAQNCGSSVEFTGSGNTVTLNVTDANANTIVGKSSGNATLSGTHSAILGDGCGSALTTGGSNIFIGYQAGNAVTSGSGNTIIGDASLISGLNGSSTVNGFYALGASVGVAGTPTTPFMHNYGGNQGGNTFVGYNSGSFNAGQAANNLDNTSIGQSSLMALTTGGDNIACGYQAGKDLTTGDSNSFVGRDAGMAITTGGFNTLTGRGSGTGYGSSESNNVILGATAGTVGESGVMRLGNDGSVAGSSATTKTWAYGIRGVTTTNNDAIAVLIDSAGQLGTVSSSARYKENVQDMGNSSSPLMKLRPVTFNYKSNGNKDYGLIAEEVHEVMPDLVVYNDQGEPETVKYHIMCSILLNEVQKLSKRVQELESKQ